MENIVYANFVMNANNLDINSPEDDEVAFLKLGTFSAYFC